MRKKFALLLTFVLAFAVALGVLAGCSKKEEVTVTITKTTLTLEVGKSGSLSATASDGSEIVWSTSNAAIVSVNEKGKVTGESAGTATVTATVKDGDASASCEVTVKEAVTFAFKDADGNALSSVQVDRETGPVQITATASDGSKITNWLSNDEDIVTVENGLLTGIQEGTTKVTVSSATGSGEIDVTVIDSFDGEHYEITTTETVGKWYYYARTDGGRQLSIKLAELRGDVITFEYENVGVGSNWNSDDMFLAIKNPDIEESSEEESKWYELSMKINSSIATTVTVNDTRVDLVKGENNVKVYYEQWQYASAIIYFGNGEAGTHPLEMKVVLTEVNWKAFTPKDLSTPSFTLSGAAVTINDANSEGVKQYQIGLFKEGEATPVFSQPIRSKSGTLDASSFETNGTYIVKVRAIGILGFNNSAWSAGDDIKYTVNNGDIKYSLSNPDGKYGGGAAAALTSGKWEFFTIVDEGAGCESAEFDNGTLTFKGTNGWSADSVQLLRNYSHFDVGEEISVTMTLLSTLGGKILVCGEVVELVANEAKTVTVDVTQQSGKPTVSIILSVLAEDDSEWPGKKQAADSMQYGVIEFTVSNVAVVSKG